MSNQEDQYTDYIPGKRKMYIVLTILLILTALVVYFLSSLFQKGGAPSALKNAQSELVAKTEILNQMIDDINSGIQSFSKSGEFDLSEGKDSMEAARDYLKSEISANYEDGHVLFPMAELLVKNYEREFNGIENKLKNLGTPDAAPADCSDLIAKNKSLNSQLRKIKNSWPVWFEEVNKTSKRKVSEVTFKINENNGVIKKYQIKRGGDMGDGKVSTNYGPFKNIGMKFE